MTALAPSQLKHRTPAAPPRSHGVLQPRRSHYMPSLPSRRPCKPQRPSLPSGPDATDYLLRCGWAPPPQLGFIFLKLYDAESKLPGLRDSAFPTFLLHFSPHPLKCCCAASGFDRILFICIPDLGVQFIFSKQCLKDTSILSGPVDIINSSPTMM